MTDPPTTIDRIKSMCIIYIFVSIILVVIGIVVTLIMPMLKDTLATPVILLVLSSLGVLYVYIFIGVYLEFKHSFDKIPGFFRKHWKLATWREEEAIEE